MKSKQRPDRAPISAQVRNQLQRDTQSVESIKAAARRCGDETLSHWDAADELDHARQHFELGCWLHHYAGTVGQPDALADRIDCVRRCWEAGVYDVNYSFYSVFRFGERQFDTCFEMGDGEQVAQALMELAREDPDGPIAAGVRKFGWEMGDSAGLRP